MKVVREELSPNHFKYYLIDENGDDVSVLNYYNLVNYRFALKKRKFLFNNKYAAEEFRDFIEKFNKLKPIIFKDLNGSWFRKKTYKFIPAISKSLHFRVIWILENSGKSNGRHHYDWVTCSTPEKCKEWFERKIFKPTKKIVS